MMTMMLRVVLIVVSVITLSLIHIYVHLPQEVFLYTYKICYYQLLTDITVIHSPVPLHQ